MEGSKRVHLERTSTEKKIEWREWRMERYNGERFTEKGRHDGNRETEGSKNFRRQE